MRDLATRLATRKLSQKAGSMLKTAGYAQLSLAPSSMPDTSVKIWKGMTVGEARTHDPEAAKRRNREKYDWQPRGGSNRVKMPQRRGKRARRSSWDEHWSRRPSRVGELSQPGQAEIARHRRRQVRKGTTKVAAGKALPYVGYAVYGYQLFTADSPEEAVGMFVADATYTHRVHGFYGLPTDSSVTGSEWLYSVTGGASDRNNQMYELPPMIQTTLNLALSKF
jgi:hypothetical protein